MDKINEAASSLGIDTKFIHLKDGIYHINHINASTSSSLGLHISTADFLLTSFRLIFYNCVFDMEIKFSNKHININSEILGFENCIFNKWIEFKTCHFKRMIFKNSTFEDSVAFNGCIFNDKVNFSNSTFNANVHFNNSAFNNYADFNSCKFLGDTYFHRAIFKKDLQIWRAHFAEVANFYFATFEDIPNFSACVFEKPKKANFVGVDVSNISTNKIKEYAKNMTKRDESVDKENNKKPRDDNEKFIQHAQNARDSFRTIKDTLIAQNNLLEAQTWHRLELYAKEIELQESINKKGIEAQNNEDEKKNAQRIREFVDSKLLCFYRHLCDHHTDLLRVWHNLILLVALYFGFIRVLYYQYLPFDEITQMTSLQIYFNDLLDLLPYKRYIGLILAAIVFCVLIYVIIKGIKKMPDLETIKIFKINFPSFVADIKSLFIFVLISMLVSCVGFIIIPYINYDLLSLLLCALFVAFYVWLISIQSVVFRYIICVISYFVFAYIFIQSPIFMQPIVGKLLTNNDILSGLNYETHGFQSLTFVYTILMFLVLFSFQKTVRKNSIIPS